MVILGFGAVLLIRGFLLRGAIAKVVRIFRQRRSSCSETPKTIDELGLTPPDFPDKLLKPKDYKPYAVEALIQAGVVRVTKDGKACLDEQKLKGSALEDSHDEKPQSD
jgi:hypothetical protein